MIHKTDKRKKGTEWKIAWMKTYSKTTAEKGRHHNEGLLIAAEHKNDGSGQQRTWISEGELQGVSKTHDCLKSENQHAHYVQLPY